MRERCAALRMDMTVDARRLRCRCHGRGAAAIATPSGRDESDGMRSGIRVNPQSDVAFVALVDRLADDVVAPDELQALLRETHPDAVVRERGLSGEPVGLWYVYRDGVWTDPFRPER